MTKRLSNLIEQAKQDEIFLSDQEIENLVRLDQQIKPQRLRAYQPKKILRFFNPFKLIVMIAIISSLILPLFLLLNPFNSKEVNERLDSLIQPIPPINTVLDQSNNQPVLSTKSSRQTEPAVVQTETFKDTTYRGQVLVLSKPELEQIGFEIDDFGYYYLNELSDGNFLNFWSFYRTDGPNYGSNGFGCGGYINQAITKSPSHKSYYPVCVTSIFGDEMRSIRGLPLNFEVNFGFHNDTLIPVLFRGKEFGNKTEPDLLAWFRVDEAFFSDLSTNQQLIPYSEFEQIRQMARLNTDHQKDIVVHDFSTYAPEIFNSIKLDRSKFSCLGIQDFGDSLVMDYNSSGKHTVIWLSHPGGGTHHVSLPWVSAKEIDHHGVAPILSVYDPIQRAQIKVRPEACYVMDSLRPGIDWLELSIPIEFISDSTQVGYQCTFWFLPSDELFNCLPDGIGEAMRKEYNYNVKPKIVELVIIEDFHPTKTENTVPKEAQPCVYFPSFCEGLSGLDNLNIYPNPVGDQLSVEVTLNRAKRIDYRIFDLAGRQVNLDYLDKKYPDSGIYTENFDMQALKPGFYLLVLTDLEGGKMTKRLVKE